jgi:hypothetical protein
VLAEFGQRCHGAEQGSGEAVELVDDDPVRLTGPDLSMIELKTGRSIVPPDTSSSCGSMTTWTPLRSAHSRIARS